MIKALWGGRFKKEMSSLLKCFSYSLEVDKELLEAEIKVNEAWAEMLGKAGILTQTETTKLISAIKSVARELRKADLSGLTHQYEDIHTLIQQSLEKKVGDLGKKIHTGRSRNDLVVTSTRLYLREKQKEIVCAITGTQKALVGLAKKSGSEVIAGLTHLRLAQPVLMAHHLLAYVEMLEEDKARIEDCLKRINVMTLGAAALAGSALPLDQKFLAKKLGFSKIATNSLAAVSDRAFMTEFLSGLSILWMHLSRLSEDFILWNSEAFHYIELDDAFATGSSLMPQKKNPDVFELIRGRSGGVFGALMGMLTLQKGLPLAYNRDLQEDKPALFQVVGMTGLALELLAETLKTTTFNHESMEFSVHEDNLFATDILEYLVRKGVPFSKAHQVIGQAVRYAAENEKSLREISIKQWKAFAPQFEEDVYSLFDVQKSVSAKKTIGSTNPKHVNAEIAKWQQLLKA